MHRSARTLTVMSLVALLAAASLPAQAKSSRPKLHRGKKALGEIVSFDAATSELVVDLPGDEDFTGTVDPDVQVKLDHRGWAKKGGSHGNPTEGSTDDLTPGTLVLRMKVEDDLVTKIRIRPAADEAPPAENGDDEGTEPGDDSTEDATDDSTEDATEDSSGDSTDDTATDDSDNDPEDELEDHGDSGDALPPLPVPQP